MIDYLVNPLTGDIDLTSDDIQFTQDSITSLRQRLELRYNTWLSEWDYNINFGTPYRQRLLIAGVPREQVDAEFISQAILEPDVNSVRNISSVYNASTRTYSLSSLDVFTDNQIVTVNVTNPEATNFKYPEPATTSTISVCPALSGLYVDEGYVDEGYVAEDQEDPFSGCVLREASLYVFDDYVDSDYVAEEVN